MLRRCVVALALVLATAASARADDVVAYEVDGDADAAASDARVAALDDAFAQAIQRALSENLSADVRKAHKAELDREIVARARLWVAKFTVSKDSTDDGRRQLVVSVRIDLAKVRARLTELGITDTTPVAPNVDHPAANTRGVVILLRVARPNATVADYGEGGDPHAPGLTALATAVRGASLTVRAAPTTGTAARPTGDLLLTDDEVDALATTAQAEVALVASVTVGAPVPLRGVAGSAALVSAHVRLIERGSHKLIGEGAASVAATGENDAAAIDAALTAAAADLVAVSASAAPHPMHPAPAFHGDDAPLAEPGVVLVRLPARTPYAMVVAEQKYLAGAKGVRSATVRRLSPGGWVIGVATSDGVDHVAQMVKKAPATDTAAAVKVTGDIVELELSGSP